MCVFMVASESTFSNLRLTPINLISCVIVLFSVNRLVMIMSLSTKQTVMSRFSFYLKSRLQLQLKR